MKLSEKLQFFFSGGGSPAPGQSLFDAYKARVEADSGTVQDEAATLALYNEQVEDSLRSSLVMHVAAQAGNRLTLGNVNKAYGLNDTPYYDAVQTSASEQPELFADGYQFGSGTQNLTFAGSAGYAPTGSITAMSWVFTNLTRTNSDPIIAKLGTKSTLEAFGLYLSESSKRWIRALVAPDDNSLIGYNSTALLPENAYSHAAVVYDAPARTITLYVNGQPSGVYTAADGVPASHYNANGVDWTYGDRNNGIRSVMARLNDGRIYDAALSATQIQAIYNNTKGYYGIS